MADRNYVDGIAGEVLAKRVAVVIDQQDALVYALTPEREGLTGIRGMSMHAANEGGSIRVLVPGEVHVASVNDEPRTHPEPA